MAGTVLAGTVLVLTGTFLAGTVVGGGGSWGRFGLGVLGLARRICPGGRLGWGDLGASGLGLPAGAIAVGIARGKGGRLGSGLQLGVLTLLDRLGIGGDHRLAHGRPLARGLLRAA